MPATPAEVSSLALLREQNELLQLSSPEDINFLTFLRIKRSAQQRRTAQRNRLAKIHQGDADMDMRLSSTMGTYVAASAGNHYTADIDPLETDFGSSRTSVVMVSHPSSRMNGNNHRRSAVSFTTEPQMSMGLSLDGSGVLGTSTAEHHVNPLDEVPAMARGVRDAMLTSEEAAPQDIVLVPCPHCGRTFAPDRLARHTGPCSKQRGGEMKRKPSGHSATSSKVASSRR